MTYSLVFASGLVIFTIFLYSRMSAQITDQVTNELAAHIRSFLLFSRSADLPPEEAARMYADGSGFRVTLIRKDGAVIGESDLPWDELLRMENHGDRPELLRALSDSVGRAIRFSTTLNEQRLYVAQAVRQSEYGFKFVRLSAPLAAVEATVGSVRQILIISGLVTLLLIALAAVYLSHRIATPIRKIAMTAENIRQGNFAARVDVVSHDEIGQLGHVMNQLAKTLQEDFNRLHKIGRVRTEFLGNVTHELKTPIASTVGYLETLLDGALDDEKVNRSFLQRALENAQRLEALVTDLVEIARIETGEMPMDFQQFDLLPLVKEVYSDALLRTAGRDLEILLNTYESSLNVYGDPHRIRQVLENLMTNAIQYTDLGQVKISAHKVQDGVTVTIADTGIGIPTEMQDRVFERFYRTDSARARVRSGTGLGLAIVKHIIEAHGSRITLASNPGHGTTFTFTLPLQSGHR